VISAKTMSDQRCKRFQGSI
jgi:hypothetical protein